MASSKNSVRDIERIIQKGGKDCGVACVAMLIQRYAGCPAASSYDAAKAVMFGARRPYYTATSDLRRALRAFGVQIGHRRVPFLKINTQDMGLPFDAIISTKPRSNGVWHWLVWDAEAKTLHDPNPRKQFNGHRFADHYIKVRVS